MTATRILDGLEDCRATGAEAHSMARLGFLEWVFAGTEAATAEAARGALREIAPQEPRSAAARAFVDCLREAARSVHAPRRRGRRQPRLN